MSAAEVWAYLESQPGFNEDLRQAEEDFKAGRVTRFAVTRRGLRRVPRKPSGVLLVDQQPSDDTKDG
jgi:hypothetical protein